jgi:hypothetical protein
MRRLINHPVARASVVLPHWRGPWIRTTGVSASPSVRRKAAKRGYVGGAAIPANRNLIYGQLQR